MENVWGVFAKFAVRSPGVASFLPFYLSYSPPWVIIVFLQYHTVSSNITSKEKYADA